MNVSIIEELITRNKDFTVHLCGHTDPIRIEPVKHKASVNRKKKTLELMIPGTYGAIRHVIIDFSSITHVEYYYYSS